MARSTHRQDEAAGAAQFLVWSGTITFGLAVGLALVALGLLGGVLALVAGFGVLTACIGAENRR